MDGVVFLSSLSTFDNACVPRLVVWVSFFGTIIARKRDSQYYTCAVLFNLTLRPGRHGTHETAFITETIDGSIGWLAVARMRSSA